MNLSETLFAKAQRHIPGGVNSPVRAFNGVGGTPLFIKRGDGAYIIDVDDKRYLDYVGSWGPMILGHANPKVISFVEKSLANGLSFGAPTAIEIQMADKISELMPSMEMVRMVNSGTEATMTALRLARGFTGRDKILKFAGCYHGHSDSLLVNAGSGALTLGVPSSPGVPKNIAELTLTAEFNNLDSVQQLFEKQGSEIAAIIVEPVACNMNCILPVPGFLAGLREICNQYNTVLIFDEVITGFRVALGGAQEYFKVKPDLTTLGKIIGGGMPVGAFGGKREIMQQIAPLGPVYQAGTLSGNPIAMAAGYATLKELSQPGFYEQLNKHTGMLILGLNELAQTSKVPFTTNHMTGIFGVFFTEEESVTQFQQVKQCNIERFKQFFHYMLEQGVYLAPSAFESGFISCQHQKSEINQTLQATEAVLAQL